MFDIPPSTPFADEHWSGHTMPGGTMSFQSGQHATQFIKAYRNAFKIAYDPSQPADPSFRTKDGGKHPVLIPTHEELNVVCLFAMLW